MTTKATDDPARLRAAVKELSPRARSALRILVRSPRPVLATDLETVARAAVPDDATGQTAVSQIVSRDLGSVTQDYSRFGREPTFRLSPIDPMRQRIAVLLQDPIPPAPPLPPAEEDEFEARQAEFLLAVLVAAVDQIRPRVTQTWSLHRVDMRPFADLFGAAIGAPEEILRRIREANGLGLLGPDQGRLVLGPDVDEVAKSPFAQLLRLRVAHRTGQDVFRVLLGVLLDENGWVTEKALLEAGGVCAQSFLYSGPLQWLRSELMHVAQLPGVQVHRGDGPTFYRLTDLARRFFAGESVQPEPAKGSVLVQPNMQIVVSPGAPFGVVAKLGRIAKLKSLDRVAIFTLDEATVRRTAAEGWTARHSLELLEGCAAHGVPTTVARALSDWARLRGSVRLTVGAVLQTDLSISEIRRILGSDVTVEPLAEGWLRVESHDAGLVEVKLRKAGVACTPFPGLTLKAVPPVEDDDGEGVEYSRDTESRDGSPPRDASLVQLGKVLLADARRAMRVPKFE